MSRDFAGWDGQVKCPFYRRSDKKKHRIICEGIGESTRLNLVFLGKEAERVAHLDHFCSEDFERCPLYHCANSKYEEAPTP